MHVSNGYDGSPTARVLAALVARGGPEPRGSGGGNWSARCPAHDDANASMSFRAAADGRALVRCHAGCSVEDIAEALGMRTSDLFAPRPDREQGKEPGSRQRVTMAEIARVKCLPVEALTALGWQDDRRGVTIPYVTRDGKPHRTRVRTALSAKDGSRWANDGEGQIAYEPDGGATARAHRTLVIVEGETDTATLLAAGIPALGLPGASTASLVQSHHLEGIERVYVVHEPDKAGEKFAADVPARLGELGFRGTVFDLRMPDGAKDPNALWCRDPDRERFGSKFRAAMAEAETQRRRGGPVEWLGASEIFAPLPPVAWRVQGIQLGPGRPGLWAGYGASAKTLASQSLGLAVASGTAAWGHFETVRGVVRHMDYEQGWHATARRYQRLALGHGIDAETLGDRLAVAVFPSIYLDSDGAVDAYAWACDGADLVILDALRGATPTRDENDSSIRQCLDNLSRVSEKTGAAFLVLHHAGKPKDGHSDPRTLARGSSAIFDACGCVYVVVAGKDKTDPRKVSQVKQPAEAEGGSVGDFLLAVEDVEDDGSPSAGVRVMHRSIEKADPTAVASTKYKQDTDRLREVIRQNRGAAQATILEKSGINHGRACRLLRSLTDEGRISAVSEGSGKPTRYYLEVDRG